MKFKPCTYCSKSKEYEIKGIPMCLVHARQWHKNEGRFLKYGSAFYINKMEEGLKIMRGGKNSGV